MKSRAVILFVLSMALAERADAGRLPPPTLESSITDLLAAIQLHRAMLCPGGPRACGSDRDARRADRLLFGAEKVFTVASRLVADGKIAVAVIKGAGGARKIEIAGPLAGSGVNGRLDTFVETAFSSAEDAQADVIATLGELCSAFRTKLEKKQSKADQLLAVAATLRSDGQRSLALKFVGKAIKLYERLEKRADRLATRPCPPPKCGRGCPTEHSTFEPGGTNCVDLAPIPPGMRLCYDTVIDASDLGATLELRGPICYQFGFAPGGRIALDGSLDPGGAFEPLDVSGTIQTTACNDSLGFARVSKVVQSIVLRSPELGRAKLTSNVNACPPTMTLLGGLLPVPPSAQGFCEGDAITEDGVFIKASVSGVGSERSNNFVRHDVTGIEAVDVPVGSFMAARVETTIRTEARIGGRLETANFSLTSWLASEVGAVRVIVREEGATIVTMELIEVTPAE